MEGGREARGRRDKADRGIAERGHIAVAILRSVVDRFSFLEKAPELKRGGEPPAPACPQPQIWKMVY